MCRLGPGSEPQRQLPGSQEGLNSRDVFAYYFKRGASGWRCRMVIQSILLYLCKQAGAGSLANLHGVDWFLRGWIPSWHGCETEEIQNVGWSFFSCKSHLQIWPLQAALHQCLSWMGREIQALVYLTTWPGSVRTEAAHRAVASVQFQAFVLYIVDSQLDEICSSHMGKGRKKSYINRLISWKDTDSNEES